MSRKVTVSVCVSLDVISEWENIEKMELKHVRSLHEICNDALRQEIARVKAGPEYKKKKGKKEEVKK